MVTVFEGIFICYSHLAFLTSILNWLKQKKRRKKACFAERKKEHFQPISFVIQKKQKGITHSMKKTKKTKHNGKL